MYTYSDSEDITEKSYGKYIVIGAIALLILFLLGYIGVNLSRGEELDFIEYRFLDSSGDADPSATCLEYHKSVLSTNSIYDEFVEDCNWEIDTPFDDGFFSNDVYVVYFVNDTILEQPHRFFDYPFMVDGNEIIRVSSKSWDGTMDEWYVYFVQMTKDQIETVNIVFD